MALNKITPTNTVRIIHYKLFVCFNTIYQKRNIPTWIHPPPNYFLKFWILPSSIAIRYIYPHFKRKKTSLRTYLWVGFEQTTILLRVARASKNTIVFNTLHPHMQQLIKMYYWPFITHFTLYLLFLHSPWYIKHLWNDTVMNRV